MKPRTTVELAILCATGLLALALLFDGLHGAGVNGSAVVWVVVGLSIGAGMIAWFRHLTARKRAQAELSGGEHYRQLADEFRRLTDLAITAHGAIVNTCGSVSSCWLACPACAGVMTGGWFAAG
jgi:hypothetical protein